MQEENHPNHNERDNRLWGRPLSRVRPVGPGSGVDDPGADGGIGRGGDSGSPSAERASNGRTDHEHGETGNNNNNIDDDERIARFSGGPLDGDRDVQMEVPPEDPPVESNRGNGNVHTHRSGHNNNSNNSNNNNNNRGNEPTGEGRQPIRGDNDFRFDPWEGNQREADGDLPRGMEVDAVGEQGNAVRIPNQGNLPDPVPPNQREGGVIEANRSVAHRVGTVFEANRSFASFRIRREAERLAQRERSVIENNRSFASFRIRNMYMFRNRNRPNRNDNENNANNNALHAINNANNNNNNDDDDDNNNNNFPNVDINNAEEDFNDALDDLFVQMIRNRNQNDDDEHAQASRRWDRRISARARQSIPSTLFNMVREGRTCTSVLSGWGISEQGSCLSTVRHCASHPNEVWYTSKQSRGPLHEACLRGACRHVIRALLEATNYRGATDRDRHWNTPLHLLFVDSTLSVLNNSNIVWSPEYLAGLVEDLIDHNPEVVAGCTNNNGDTPLHSACMAPETMVDPSTIVRLLEANPSAAHKRNSSHETPLRLHCERRNASPEVAELLLNQNLDALVTLDSRCGWAPIHAAAANANFRLLRYLVEARPDAVKVQTSQRQTALHLLCQNHTHLSAPSSRGSSSGVTAAVELLLRTDPEAVVHKDTVNGQTPLHLLCKTEGSRSAPLPVVTLLLDKNPSAAAISDFQQYLPLHYACEMGCAPEVVRALLEAHPDAARALTRKKDSALSLACTRNKSPETVQMLIQANPSALTETNDYGFSPLHCVCRNRQPRMGIVEALVAACPESLGLETNAGETPLRLAETNTGTFAGILQLLATNGNKGAPSGPGESGMNDRMSWTDDSIENADGNPRQTKKDDHNGAGGKSHQEQAPLNDALDLLNNNYRNNYRSSRDPTFSRKSVKTNKMGNTPLHDACFLKTTPYEHLEMIAKKNPEYIRVRNNAGHTPLQLLCMIGRIDERIISTFAQMGGPEIFAEKDSNGNTPLHAAVQQWIDAASIRCLIRAAPDALRSRTTYGDTPLHLACLRRCTEEVVQEMAMAASSGDVLPALVPNLAAHTPIGIAMANFKETRDADKCPGFPGYGGNAYNVLSTLIKIVYYGPQQCQQQGLKNLSLLRACVVLHRQNIRLDPTFIRQVIHMYPEEVKQVDEDGNYPLHIEASIPIEKMTLLDGNCPGSRMGILRVLLEAYPSACAARNKENQFPLGLMINAGRLWGHTIAVALRAFPPALHWCKGVDDRFGALLLEKASKECGTDTLFSLLVSRPDLFEMASSSGSIQHEYSGGDYAMR
ncbi:unnamed protein product [Pseudo-nitzschia multistriata]|uniref:Uncharacterized protein n=1 Tax=Pseudo-nitzschia multistriata TaxID=183589 RepID=A0A448YVH7_9STRA|nr:unnamed protein product [Pseudo-nitzschia multistriata]